MIAGVYVIYNVCNGKRYIGSAQDIDQRWANHRSQATLKRHVNKHLENAWHKYGEDAFIFMVLELVSVERLFEREQYYMDMLEPEYNLAPKAGGNRGYHHTAKARANMREGKLRIGYKPHPSAHINAAAKLTGAKRPADLMERIASKNRGQKRPAQAERNRSPEMRAKVSAGLTGKPKPYMSELNRTPESIAKRTAGLNAYYARKRAEKAAKAQEQQ